MNAAMGQATMGFLQVLLRKVHYRSLFGVPSNFGAVKGTNLQLKVPWKVRTTKGDEMYVAILYHERYAPWQVVIDFYIYMLLLHHERYAAWKVIDFYVYIL